MWESSHARYEYEISPLVYKYKNEIISFVIKLNFRDKINDNCFSIELESVNDSILSFLY